MNTVVEPLFDLYLGYYYNTHAIGDEIINISSGDYNSVGYHTIIFSGDNLKYCGDISVNASMPMYGHPISAIYEEYFNHPGTVSQPTYRNITLDDIVGPIIVEELISVVLDRYTVYMIRDVLEMGETALKIVAALQSNPADIVEAVGSPFLGELSFGPELPFDLEIGQYIEMKAWYADDGIHVHYRVWLMEGNVDGIDRFENNAPADISKEVIKRW